MVDKLAERTWKLGAAKAIEEIEKEQNDLSWPTQFLRSSGALDVTKDLEHLVSAMADYGEACTITDLEELGLQHGIDNVTRAVTLARWFGILDENDDQSLRLAPLLEDCWKRYEAN